jgi:penicillin-binding protein 2
MPLNFDENIIEKNLNKKIRFSVILIVLSFFFIFFRLWYLQILNGSTYTKLSINNRIRVTKIPAPRGIILSKNKDIFVKSTPSFDLNLIPQDTPDIQKVLNKVSDLLDIDIDNLKKTIKKKEGRPPFEPITLKKELSWNEMSLFLSRKMDFQGLTIDVVPKRLYCIESFASHVFGFLGMINSDELNKQGDIAYSSGDLIGKYGLEKWGEKYLRGKKGGLQSEVDVFGNRQKILAEIKPVPGNNIIISIEPNIQNTAEDLLKEKNGAIVAMDPQNGDIFALASSPGFDSNLFARGIEYDEWEKLINNSFHPLMNKAIQCQQPPGSVFKVITAVAALEEKAVDPNQKFFCPGYFKLGNRRFNCWKKGGHGWMNMKEAITESCDCYFYNISLRMGVDVIAKYAKMFMLGEKTGIELEGEKEGFIPTSKWKKKRFSVSWQKGETLNTAIGQGFLLTTPLQMAEFFSAIATGKTIPKPRIVLNIDGENIKKTFKQEILKRVNISKETISFIKDALVAVVNNKKGTGRGARLEGVLVAGKTGTAQVISKKVDIDDKDVPIEFKDHAWFVCFAPAEKPQIVVTVFIENGGSGGKVAAPIAKEIIKKFFNVK